MRAAVDLESLPSPACSHSDSTSRIDRPLTAAPITIARSGSVRSSLVPRANSFDERLGGIADPRDLHQSSPSAVCSLRERNPLRSPLC
jgi:hypothetical protein